MLQELHEKKRFRRMRESSWDRTGANMDEVAVPPGATHELPQLEGPGIVRHLWLTSVGTTADFHRELEMAICFDGESPSQVELPVADFFLFGHGELVDVDAAPIQVSRQPHVTAAPYRGSLNCFFPMPFARSARFRFRNRGEGTVTLYYHVDWERHQALPEPVLHFRATLRSEATRPPAGATRVTHGGTDNAVPNLGTGENYVFLDAQGYEGHYVGTALSIACRPGGAGKWWEGDDMFVIDGERWPPRLHGTGTEDYFGLAWGFRKVECRPEYGVTFLRKSLEDRDQIDGSFSMYRFHLADPIPFERSILATVEHGHANDCEADYRSVAFWYGRRR